MASSFDASSSSSNTQQQQSIASARATVGETNALNLRWSFGFNSIVASTVHSLSSSSRQALFYVSAHTGVIHDLEHDNQYLLQGHCNQITSVCVSKDKRWIATADFGTDAMIVIWDSLKATPVKLIPQKENGGVAAMDMSADAMFLVTLSYNYPQTLSVWEWPANTKTPAIAAPIGNRDYQHCVRFNPVDVRDIVSNGSKEVIFWNWTEDTIAAFHPPKGISKLKKAVRNLSQTTFIPYTTKAVTATTSGHIIAWDYPVSELVQSTGRDAIKILKLVKSGINLLDTVLDKFIVCGCADGAVRFFDFQFRVVAWFEDIQSGHITSISFADQSVNQAANANANAQGQVSMEEFSVPDFVVGTSQGKVLQLDAKTMEHLTADKRRGKLLVQGFDDEVHALDAHPTLPLFAVGTLRGSLQIWDVDDRKMIAYRKFEIGEVSQSISSNNQMEKNKPVVPGAKKTDISTMASASAAAAKNAQQQHNKELTNDSQQIQVVRFGPKGVLLAIGFSNGFIKVVSSQEASYSQDVPLLNMAPPLRDVCSFHRSEKAITNITFSSDGNWIASSDAEGCVAVYRFWHRDDDLEKAVEWIYVGKHRAHYQPIISLFFAEALNQGEEEAAPAAGAAGNEESKENNSDPRSTAVSTRNALSSLSAATSAVLASNNSNLHQRPVPRLYSLGEDRVLQEYDLASSSIRSGLKIKATSRMEQTACPTAMMSLPGRKGPAANGATASVGVAAGRDLIITANDEYKLKVWEITTPQPAAGSLHSPSNALRSRGRANTATSQKKLVKNRLGKLVESDDPTLSMSPSELEEHERTIKCRKTLLAPMYGGPINKLFHLPKRELNSSNSGNKSGIVPSDFLVYSTFEKIVGLIKLPLDGNPNKSMALIAHPGEVSAIVSTFDGKYLLTAGGSDRCVNLWSVATNALDASITLGGKGIEPYLSLVEGGQQGAFFQELLDYFYYAQLRSQRLSTTDSRKISGYIHVDESVNLMRAMGFYPTEHQVVHMKSEVRYENQAIAALKTAAAGGAAPSLPPPLINHELLNLDEFLKLYVNHRPVSGLGRKSFEEVFRLLGAIASRGNAMSSEHLLQALMNTGEEPMTLDEITHCFNALLGENYVPHDAQDTSGRNDLSSGMKRLLSRLPAQIDPQRFAEEILGFEDYSTVLASEESHASSARHRGVRPSATGGIEEGDEDETSFDGAELQEEKEANTSIVISPVA